MTCWPKMARGLPPGSQSKAGTEVQGNVLLLLCETLGGPGPQKCRGRGESEGQTDSRCQQVGGARHARECGPQMGLVGAQSAPSHNVAPVGYNQTGLTVNQEHSQEHPGSPVPSFSRPAGRKPHSLPLPQVLLTVQMGCGVLRGT